MALIFNDTFTEASGTPNLDAHTPDTGIGWILLGRNGVHTITIPSANDRAQPSADVNDGWIIYYTNPSPTDPDVTVQTTYKDTGTVDATDATGVFVRLDDKLIDDFNRANETPVTGWTDYEDEASVSSNKLIHSGAGEKSVLEYDAVTFNSDQELYVLFGTIGSPPEVFRIRLRTRDIGTAAQDGYALQFEAGTFLIMRDDNDVLTQLGASIGGTMTSNTKLGFRALGSDLTAYQDTGSGWVVLGTRSDATYAYSAKVNFGIPNEIEVDSVYASNVASGAIFPAISGYFAGWNDDTGTNGYIYKLIDGTPTQIGSNGGTFINNSVLKFTVIGSTLTLYDDDVSVISQTDTSLPNLGKSGIWWGGIKLSTDDIDTNQCQDSFSVTEIVAIAIQKTITGIKSRVLITSTKTTIGLKTRMLLPISKTITDILARILLPISKTITGIQTRILLPVSKTAIGIVAKIFSPGIKLITEIKAAIFTTIENDIIGIKSRIIIPISKTVSDVLARIEVPISKTVAEIKAAIFTTIENNIIGIKSRIIVPIEKTISDVLARIEVPFSKTITAITARMLSPISQTVTGIIATIFTTVEKTAVSIKATILTLVSQTVTSIIARMEVSFSKTITLIKATILAPVSKTITAIKARLFTAISKTVTGILASIAALGLARTITGLRASMIIPGVNVIDVSPLERYQTRILGKIQ